MDATGSPSVTFESGSSVPVLNLNNSTATVTATGNITQNLTLQGGSTLVLNTDLILPRSSVAATYLSLYGSTVNANNKNITAPTQIYLDGSNSRLNNRGNLTTDALYVSNQPFDIRATDTVGRFAFSNGATTLADGSTLNILDLTNVTAAVRTATIGTVNLTSGTILTEKRGLTTGLTLTGTAAGALSINDTSKLRLELDGAINGWALRWANPAGGDHIADLNTLIAAGKIDFTLTNGAGYFLSSVGGYTYLQPLAPVPEPAATMLIAVGGLASGWVIRRRRLASAVV